MSSLIVGFAFVLNDYHRTILIRGATHSFVCYLDNSQVIIPVVVVLNHAVYFSGGTIDVFINSKLYNVIWLNRTWKLRKRVQQVIASDYKSRNRYTWHSNSSHERCQFCAI